MSNYTYLKEQVYEANMEIPRENLAIVTFGNVSGIDRDAGVIAIKPSGVPYHRLRVEDIVVLDLENNVVEGTMRPSSDTKTHTLLYRHFPSIGGVCHTHSTYAVAWAQAIRAIPNLGTTHADHLTTAVPVTEIMSDEMIQRDYELETGNQILDLFSAGKLSYEETEMVLVACHGPFTWGKDPAKAVYNSVVLEEIAKMAYLTLNINPSAQTIKQGLIDKHYFRKHGKDAYYGQGC
ncbi:L-ribulose-5-phosphate 4-epimerase [Dyadobacter fanqingshengii]|uniref:L-ribulose-5-phosphate 4-epimerase n=1 Tax=Dyadobacter fanqingshengii TaxID=2906443 RepID=A0A9X1TGA1_9BACT|nr:L-ribulose-5-phosphate 4-epimerase [Dyadobacter fanqingshengii]MCF0040282.1 L-ribulose-5-phosphate 4-epimerase [Dyadobacter fanqingshengii]USJ37970.1 L-ribulose-5-phosphate 4-epimerase [Dyadobacter fanqingshengii]